MEYRRLGASLWDDFKGGQARNLVVLPRRRRSTAGNTAAIFWSKNWIAPSPNWNGLSAPFPSLSPTNISITPAPVFPPPLGKAQRGREHIRAPPWAMLWNRPAVGPIELIPRGSSLPCREAGRCRIHRLTHPTRPIGGPDCQISSIVTLALPAGDIRRVLAAWPPDRRPGISCPNGVGSEPLARGPIFAAAVWRPR